MPTYEYQCKDCGKVFEKTMTIEEHERQKQKLTCPKCGSRKIRQQVSQFQVVTSHKT